MINDVDKIICPYVWTNLINYHYNTYSISAWTTSTTQQYSYEYFYQQYNPHSVSIYTYSAFNKL